MSGRTGISGVQERSTTTILFSRKMSPMNRWPDWEALRGLFELRGVEGVKGWISGWH